MLALAPRRKVHRLRHVERRASTRVCVVLIATAMLCVACGAASGSPTGPAHPTPTATSTSSPPTASPSPTPAPADDQLVGQWKIQAKLTGYVGPIVDKLDNPIGLTWTASMTFSFSCTSGTCFALSSEPQLSVNPQTVPNSFMRQGTANMMPGLVQSGSTYTGNVYYNTPIQFQLTPCAKQDVPNQDDKVTLHVTSADGSDAVSLTGTENTPAIANCSGGVQFDVLSLTGTQVAA